MHLASLTGTRVVSVWGATHPYCGFMGWQQKEEDAIQNLSFAYALTPDRNVVEDFSCEVCAGQISLLLGPTGSGKSTNKKCILYSISNFTKCFCITF